METKFSLNGNKLSLNGGDQEIMVSVSMTYLRCEAYTAFLLHLRAMVPKKLLIGVKFPFQRYIICLYLKTFFFDPWLGGRHSDVILTSL